MIGANSARIRELDPATAEISGRSVTDGSMLEPSGAVMSPDGTIYGLSVAPTQPIETFPTSYEERTIGGLDAWAFEVGKFFDGITADSTDAEIGSIAAGFPVFEIASA